MNPRSNARMAVALVVLAGMAVLAWRTMQPGKLQQVTWLLLGFFAARIVLTPRRRDTVRSESSQAPADEDSQHGKLM